MALVAILTRLGGADPERSGRAARRNAVGLAGAVLATAAIAAASGAYAVHVLMHVSTPLALVIGVGWGLTVFNLDLLLVTVVHRQPRRWQTITLITPRVVLVLLMACVIAEPLMFRAFSGELQQQMLTDRQATLSTARGALGREYSSISRLEARQAELQNILAGDKAPTYADNPDWRAAQSAVDADQTALASAERRAGCEAGGTCGSHRAGCGLICQADLTVVAQRKLELARDQRTLVAVQARLVHAGAASEATQQRYAQPQLAKVDEQLQNLQSERARELGQDQRASTLPFGLIDREEALAALMRAHPQVWAAVWLTRGIFVAIDLAPALFKLLLLLGRPTPLEREQDLVDESDLNRLRLDLDADERAHRLIAELPVREAEVRSDAAEDAFAEIHDHLREVVVRKAIREVDAWDAAQESVDGKPAHAGVGSAP